MALPRLARLLVSTMAAQPTRKRQLGMSIARSLPKYQFCVMFSVLTTRHVLLRYTCTRAGLSKPPVFLLLELHYLIGPETNTYRVLSL